MRVVLDTNVLVSAFLWQGAVSQIFRLAEQGKITICSTEETVGEFRQVLSYPKFAEKLREINKTADQIADEFLEITEVYPAKFSFDGVKSDISDNIFLACALSAQANFIVSGDKHLLGLKEVAGIPIFTPHQLLNRIKKNKKK